jgi:hypothetical protein
MKLLTQLIQVSNAQFWFEWGDEPQGYVSYGRYDQNDVYKFVGIGPRKWKDDCYLPFNCPFA